jgi:hypothetical protein
MARNSRLSKSRSSKSRPAKMGRKWTQDDVLAYKIKVVYQDLTTFFGVTDLPPPDVESEALTAQDFHTATDDWTNFMLFHMDRLMDPDDVTGTLSNRKPATIDFVRELFNVLHYPSVPQRRFLIARPKLDYLASQGSPPQVDVCIRDDTTAILLVVKVYSHLRRSDPEPRLISDDCRLS